MFNNSLIINAILKIHRETILEKREFQSIFGGECSQSLGHPSRVTLDDPKTLLTTDDNSLFSNVFLPIGNTSTIMGEKCGRTIVTIEYQNQYHNILILFTYFPFGNDTVVIDTYHVITIKSEDTMGTKQLSGHISTTKELGHLMRQRRKDLGLGIEDAAAWCNVGTRFLFDVENAKPTVEFQKTVMAAARMGIRLQWASAGESPAATPATDLILSAPPFDSGHWIASRQAAMSAATKCGIPMPSVKINSVNAGAMTITVSREATERPLISVSLPNASKREQDGGPGLVAIFHEIDRQSAQPLTDVMLALRWALFTYLIGDTNVSAADVFMQEGGGEGSRIAAFGVPACCPFSIPNTQEYAGLRIGGEWPTDWLRVDPWLALAQSIRVRPRVVFALMEEMANIVPPAVHGALSSLFNSPTLRGPAAVMSKTASARALRMSDLRKAAASQGVAGVPKQPPVPKELIADENVPYLGHETTYE